MPIAGYRSITIRESTYKLLDKLAKKYKLHKTALIEAALLYYEKTVLEPVIEGGLIPPQLLKYLKKHLRTAIVVEREEMGDEEE